MASRALTARLTNTWVNWPGSTFTDPDGGGGDIGGEGAPIAPAQVGFACPGLPRAEPAGDGRRAGLFGARRQQLRRPPAGRLGGGPAVKPLREPVPENDLAFAVG